MQRIYVYELLDPGIYIRGRAALVQLFKRWTGSPSDERLFEVSQAGMIHFADHGELWRDSEQRRALPATADDALKQAERFLKDVRDRFHGTGPDADPKAAQIRTALQECPVPSGLKHIDAVAVLHPRLGVIDHWLCRFAIELPAFPWERNGRHEDEEHDGHDHHHDHDQPYMHIDTSKPLRVQDALIEVRIGSKWIGTDRYRIIGYNQRWRPTKVSGRLSAELLAFAHDENEGQEHDDPADVSEPELVYVLDADSQRFLAPYYLTPSGHHFGFQPASEYSMVLNAIQQDGPVSTDLFLDIAGGHREQEFEVHWSFWRPDAITTNGMAYAGNGPLLPGGLVPGVYNVIADVIDTRTGQMKRHQQMVYARPAAETPDVIS